ncbi:phenylalanine--tRNA ligase subunit beta [Sulfobacillus harzensis]|uniref:Phenylalanine--tRNA ligase beta subunit n=1 Tax=Sulfobacillus harzensis TaxID=2729629 RepID=A0A7Y0Q2I4_9FIRM|nr:phenylalanine--tRNA ligase subunit beta [Sulfobacillus harzensis]NMP22370.1 phenylalanine--tRNA ligase subunit beta [Sulfobacillus harzensis]
MIVSHRWLKRHLPNLPEPRQVVAGLEQIGVEVAATKAWGENFAMVELVEVVARTPHPESDHLSLVDVRRGRGEVTRIVTGASNGFPGERLWYAPPGTTLPDGRTLSVRALRGIDSPGMLLSPEELGYQTAGGDLWVWDGPDPLGTTFLQVIGGPDTLYEVELTPNIAQYLQSVRHLARELGAIWHLPLAPAVAPFAYQDNPLAVVEAPERCPLYGLVGLKIKPGLVSPLWLQTLLLAMGHRIIHPAVDVTNFVLWDLGEPLHAFDQRRVNGPIRVRLAQPEESLTLLDGAVITLDSRDLVIADQDKALALAGIMGGIDSGVAPDTEEIWLECAHFSAPGIYQSFKKHGLMTDAAVHFGRGTDPLAVFEAPAVVTQILAEAGVLVEVQVSGVVGDLPTERLIPFNPARIRALLGVEWDDEKMRQALQGFGYAFLDTQVVVPRYRHDVESIYDLAEDVARFHGLDNIAPRLPYGVTGLARRSAAVQFEEEMRDVVASAGYHEVVTRTFANPAWAPLFSESEAASVRVTNPLREEESVLRQHILPSLLEVARYNRSRHDLAIRIFELGSVFAREAAQIQEGRELGVLLSLEPAASFPPREEATIYDLTGLADFLFSRLGLGGHREAMPNPPAYVHPGRVEALVVEGKTIGWVGELRPRIAQHYRVRRLGALVMQVDANLIRRVSQPGRPSRFPEVERDLSLVIPEAVPYQALVQAIDQLNIGVLQAMRPIDRYHGDFGTSLTVRLRFQSDQETLTDEQVDHEVGRILEQLAALDVKIRQ